MTLLQTGLETFNALNTAEKITLTTFVVCIIAAVVATSSWLKHRKNKAAAQSASLFKHKQRNEQSDTNNLPQAFNLMQNEVNAQCINYQRSQDYQTLKQDSERLNTAIYMAQLRVENYPDDADNRHALGDLIDAQVAITQRLSIFKRKVLKLNEESNKIPLNTERLRLAKQCFDAGNFKAARDVFDTERMTKEQSVLRTKNHHFTLAQQAENTRQLANNAEEFLLLARLTAIDEQLGTERFTKTCQYFEQAMMVARTPDRVLAYADFLQQYPPFSNAETLYREGLGHYRAMAQSNPSAYQPEVAMTLSNLALLLAIDTQRHSESEALYTEALKLYRELAKSNSPTFQRNVAITLNHLINLLKNDPQQQHASEQLYNELLALYRQLTAVNPWTYQPNLATTLNNMAVFISRDTPQQSQAEQLYREALDLYRSLALTNPLLYQPDVAMTLNNLANVLSHDVQQQNEAKQLYRAALTLYRESVQSNPFALQPNIANTLGALGFAHLKWEQPQQALPYLTESITLLRPYAERLPHVFAQKHTFIVKLLAKAEQNVIKNSNVSAS